MGALKANKEIQMDWVEKMVNASQLNDEAIMVPIDMRGAGKDFDDVDIETMVEKLGAKAAAEVFVACAEYREKHKSDEDDFGEMTALEWKNLNDEEGEED